jgi:diphosphomevalonate decarboxylase
VKYWGKRPVQLPSNPSLSMTLDSAFTEMTLEYRLKEENDGMPLLEFLFEGHKKDKFEQKIADYLQSLFTEFPQLKEYTYKISSSNTFPHSTGIASSASSMSALGLCLAEMISRLNHIPVSFRQASVLARLASGSACRSVYGGYVIWGHVPELDGTSDDYAIQVPFEVSKEFSDMRDAILVVSSEEKKVSSRAGHSLMESHPYATQRYEIANSNTRNLADALKKGDLDRFVRITEHEALNLHALMMSSNPSYLLIEPNTLNIVNAIRHFRKETSVPVCFTLDAGPNVHMLYLGANESMVKDWISEELLKFCENGNWIDDRIGDGPEKIM